MPYAELAFDLLWTLFWKLPFSGTTKLAIATIIKVLSRAKRYANRAVLEEEIALLRRLPSPFVYSVAWHFGYQLGGWIGRILCLLLVLLPHLFIGACYVGLYWLLGCFDVLSSLLLAVQATCLAVLLAKSLGLFSGRRMLPYTLSLGHLIGVAVFAGASVEYVLGVLPLAVVLFTGMTYYLRSESYATWRTWQSMAGVVCTLSVVALGYYGAVLPLFSPEALWHVGVLGVLCLLTFVGHSVYRLSPGVLVFLNVIATYVLI